MGPRGPTSPCVAPPTRPRASVGPRVPTSPGVARSEHGAARGRGRARRMRRREGGARVVWIARSVGPCATRRQGRSPPVLTAQQRPTPVRGHQMAWRGMQRGMRHARDVGSSARGLWRPARLCTCIGHAHAHGHAPSSGRLEGSGALPSREPLAPSADSGNDPAERTERSTCTLLVQARRLCVPRCAVCVCARVRVCVGIGAGRGRSRQTNAHFFVLYTVVSNIIYICTLYRQVLYTYMIISAA